MYLKTLTVFGFGHFHDRTFHLDQGFNVLFGQNEAGKSTLTQFMVSILFGFPTKKHPEQRYEPLDGSRFGGAIELRQHGVTYRVTRVDGPHGGTVTLENVSTAVTLPSSQLAKLLAPIDEQLFTQAYLLNEPKMSQIFRTTKQDVTDRLRHMGAVGSDFWLAQAHDLDRQADGLYKPLGRNPQLNQQLQAHRELTAKLERANAAYATYWQLLQDQRTAQAQQIKYRQQLTQKRETLASLQRLQGQWPTYVRWHALSGSAQPMTGFTQQDVTQFEQLQGRVSANDQALAMDQERLQQLYGASHLTPSFRQYLQVAPQVDPLLEQLPVLEADLARQRELQATQVDLEQRTTTIEQTYADNAGQMPRPFSLATSQQLGQAQADLATANQKRRRLQQELNELNEQYRHAQPTRQQRNPLADRQLGWLAAGLVVLVGALFLPGTLFKLIGAALGVAVGYYGVFIVDGQTPASRQLQVLGEDIRDVQAQLREGAQQTDSLTNQIEAIGAAHGLNAVPVAQWSTAQSAIGEWERLTQLLQQTHAELGELTSKITAFTAKVTASLTRLRQLPTQQLLTQLKDVQHTKTQLAAQDGKLAQITERLRHEQAASITARHERDSFLATRNLTNATDFYTRYQALREQSNQAAQRQALAEQLGHDLNILKTLNEEELRQRVTNAQTAMADVQAQLDAVTTQLATLAGQLTTLTKSGTQAVLRQRLANLETNMIATLRTWLTDRLTSQWITATLEAASSDRLPQIVQRAGEFTARLTENRYTELEITSTVIRVKRRDGVWRTMGQLSRGTAEQLDLAVKLAFAIVLQPQTSMPLVVDDGLVNFDGQRRQAAYQLLSEMGQHLQVILLTADSAATNPKFRQNVIELATQEGA